MKSEKKNIIKKNDSNNHFYKIFQNSRAQKIINIIYTIIFLVSFSYYYHYHYYFGILLMFSIISFFLILLLYFYNKKYNFLNTFKKILYQELNLSINKILITFIGVSILAININLLTSVNSNLKYILTNIISVELNIVYQIVTLVLFAIFFILILWSIGSRIIKLLKLELTKSEEFVFGFAFGAIPLIFSTFLLAITSLLYTKFILINLLIWILFSYKELFTNFKKISQFKIRLPSFKKFNDFNHYKKLILIILFISTVFLFINAIYPQPVNYDSLHTYYNVPKLSLEQHELVKFPLFPFANISKNIEMIYLNIMAVASPRFLSHIQLIYFILTLLIIYLFCKKFFTKKVGILAAIIFFFSIGFFYLSIGVKIDLSLVFYSSIILYSFFNWLKNHEAKWAIILGSLFGLSFGIKYSAILLFISIGSVIVFIALYKIIKKSNAKQYILQSFLILLFTIIFFSPWLIRNKINFNNYLYPYGIYENYPTIKTARSDYTNIVVMGGQNKIEYLLKFPIIYIKKSQHSTMQDFSPLFMLGVLLLLLYKKNYQEKILISTFFVYFILWFWKADFRIWYAAPIFMILSIFFASTIIKSKFLLKNKIIQISISTYAIICLILISTIIPTQEQLYYISGLISEKEYLNQIPIFLISEKLNNIIKKDEKILLMWESRIGFIKNNNENTLIDLKKHFNTKINKNPTEVYNLLKKENIKYIIYGHKKENSVKNLPYNTFDLNLLKDKSYKNILENINLFHQFKTNHLEEIDCTLNENNTKDLCLYKVI
jgi:dolichyl-phosphate-mannose-protein mannosyltransferase